MMRDNDSGDRYYALLGLTRGIPNDRGQQHSFSTAEEFLSKYMIGISNKIPAPHHQYLSNFWHKL